MKATTFIGINIGSISVNVAVINEDGTFYTIKKNHYGAPLRVMEEVLADIQAKHEGNVLYYGVSGHLGDVSEVEAVERALEYYGEKYDAIASLGGEALVVYVLDDHGKVINVLSQDKCAAGSGEFFVQQIQRLNISLPDAIEKAKQGKSIRLATRCSVHCKSDITHKLNKGEAEIEDILYSVLESTANKVITLLNQSRKEIKNLLVIGGVSLNDAFLDILRAKLKNKNVVVKETSAVFEAFGTALLTQDHPVDLKPRIHVRPSFTHLPSLKEYGDKVKIIKTVETKKKKLKGPFILGVDVGSTTTKAVLLDPKDHSILASHYGRTNGNPVRATKECIQKVIDQVGDQDVFLIGVTGSGREIAGAFLGATGVYNEISAHSRGAAEYDPEVDTIFEIGGQDSKYVYLQNGVPVDYAMNAACSAGTGSFLEESSKSDLGVSVYDIAGVALEASAPVKFKADCAAFINSDIRTALQEGYDRDDIVGGLVYSIVDNYLNKVKQARPVGNKVFLQGGVAKNIAIGYAFARETGKEIIIPPHPELMGAFGVALMAKEKYELGQIKETKTRLSNLVKANMKHLGSFTCRACENYCTIERYEVAGRKFPFGGLCSRYENQWKQTKKIKEKRDLAEYRLELLLKDIPIANKKEQWDENTIGIPRALLTHSLLPLYRTFLKELGFTVVLSGIDKDFDLVTNAPFCYPVQIAHGAIMDLQKHGITKIFFPHVYRLPKQEKWLDSTFCPMTQASPFYLKQAFPDITLYAPSIDFAHGYEKTNEMIEWAMRTFNINEEKATNAYRKAVKKQKEFEEKIRKEGKKELEQVLKSGETAILLVGRTYNAYPPETSQAIARKLVSKGITVIPFDMLDPPEEGETSWYFPNLILHATDLVTKYENLFLLYISNYSCNVDAFTQNTVRSKLGSKPYLILELDAHTGDAGTQTRLEAFLEIIKNYRQVKVSRKKGRYQPARILKEDGKVLVLTSQGEKLDLRDPRVKIYFPPFSQYHTDAIGIGFRWYGLNVVDSPDITQEFAIKGLQRTSGKECIPLPIIAGHMMQLMKEKKEDEVIAYFMLNGGAPCVVDRYFAYFNEFIQENQLENILIFDYDPSTSFLDISPLEIIRNMPSLISLGDIMNEIENALVVCGTETSIQQLRKAWHTFKTTTTSKKLFNQNVKILAEEIARIPRTKDPRTLPKVLVTGDFYVRFSNFFLEDLKQRFAKHNILVKSTDLMELTMYIFYHDLQHAYKNVGRPFKYSTFFKSLLKIKDQEHQAYMQDYIALKLLQHYELKMRNQFKKTGLLFDEPNNVARVYEYASTLMSPLIFGEAVTAVGKGVEALKKGYEGLILTGPYNCLPYKISQAILKPIFIENHVPLLVFDADITSPPPSFFKLLDATIQQIKTKQLEKIEKETHQSRRYKLPKPSLPKPSFPSLKLKRKS